MKRKIQASLFDFVNKKEKTVSHVPQYFIYNEEKHTARLSDVKPEVSDAKVTVEFKKSARDWGLPCMFLISETKRKPLETHQEEKLKQDDDAKKVKTADKPETASEEKKYTKGQIGLLKSLLQKAVRRSQTDLAFRTALELCCADPLALLRRLPIIMIEDTVLMPELTPLVWLMMRAHCPEFFLTAAEIKWICHVVYTLAASGRVERVGAEEKLKQSHRDLHTLKNEYRDLLYALKIRASYGGMNGDKRMLHAAIDKWFWRFQNDVKAENKAEAEVKIENKAEVDVGNKTEVGVERKAEIDAEKKIEVKVERKAEMDVKIENKAEVEVERKAEGDSGSKVEIEVERKAEVKVENGMEIGFKNGIEVGVGNGIEVRVGNGMLTLVPSPAVYDFETLSKQYVLPISQNLASWELAAVDFHCTNIIALLDKDGKEDGIDNEEWKKILWQCSSSITNKTVAPPDPEPKASVKDLYNKHKSRIISLQKYLLEKYWAH